jgi:hypothetical protein
VHFYSVLLDGIHQSGSVIMIIPGDLLPSGPSRQPSIIMLALSDGANTSLPISLSVSFAALQVTPVSLGSYFGHIPPPDTPFEFVISLGRPSVNVQCAVCPIDDGIDMNLTWHDFGNYAPSVVPAEVTLPAGVYDNVTSPGIYAVWFLLSAGDEGIDLWYPFRLPGPADPILTLVSPTDRNLGSFPSNAIPEVSITFTITSNSSWDYALQIFLTSDLDVESLGRFQAGTHIVPIPRVFWDPSPGLHSLSFLIFPYDHNRKVIGGSDGVSMCYRITGPVPGTLRLAYPGRLPFALRSDNGTAATVCVPLTITIIGWRGAGPLNLQFSLETPPVWIPYQGAVTTGPAVYEFPRSAFQSR